MGLFSLDIERYYNEMSEKGHKVRGFFCVQYPIYCIHASITDSTPDPLDNIDQAIAEFFKIKSDFTHTQIASILGTSKILIEMRVNAMTRDKLLESDTEGYSLTSEGQLVFDQKIKTREHKRSFDFYVDGISFRPLPKIFYSFYRSKLISENDSHYYTNAKGETKIARPFGPDIVHTPPDKQIITAKLTTIPVEEREAYSIPNGLESIEDLSFTKLTLQLLVGACSTGEVLLKEVIDGFAFYSLAEGLSYYEAIKRNIRIFENGLKEKLENLEFKIHIPKQWDSSSEQPKPQLISNWPEIDRYKNSQNRCFSFSSEDLNKVVDQLFHVNVSPESITNSDNNIEISIDKKALFESSDRQKLVTSLIRKRDYKFGNTDNNVYLLYLYFNTNDPFVQGVIEFKKIINSLGEANVRVTSKLISEKYPEYASNYRELLIASGEYEILENIDITKYMIAIN
jgi:hypothetical protein